MSIKYILIFFPRTVLDLPLWLNLVFPWSISPDYFDESALDDSLRCLIDRPVYTMKHPILDFAVGATCDIILEAAKEPPASRTKQLLGVVRGMGSGKTRCLEEIRRELLQRRGVLPIAITFNNGKDIRSYELDWAGDRHTVFALMVIARMASALYGKHFPYVCSLITKELWRLDTSGLFEVGCCLLEEFLRHVVSGARSQGKDVTDVVVIVDEIVKAEDILREQYKKNVVEACSVLRKAVLDIKQPPFTFNATLCISSLTLYPFAKTSSDRSVIPLGIPSALDAGGIVKEWWKCAEVDERTMLHVAACFRTLPRAVEIVDEFLIAHLGRPKNQEFIKDLFASVTNKLRIRYSWREFPDDDLMCAILFAKNVTLGKKVQRFISLSILQNSIEEENLRVSPHIVPLSSLAVLAGSKVSPKGIIEELTIAVYNDVLKEIVRLIGSAEGIIFESFVVKWLQYRWAVAKHAKKKISLIELMGITADVDELKYSLDVIATSHKPYFVNLTINSNENSVAHLEEVENIVVSAGKPIAVLVGAKDDTFDALFKVFQGEEETPLRVYIDNKSPFPGNHNSFDRYNSPHENLPQYNKVKSMCDAANIPFIFIYWTHYPGYLSVRAKDCLILRSRESENFFGPMWSLFIACRSTFSSNGNFHKKQKSSKKRKAHG